ncbi:MAG: hypothetical protein ACI36X_09390 [Bacteroidaceae bacterium]
MEKHRRHNAYTASAALVLLTAATACTQMDLYQPDTPLYSVPLSVQVAWDGIADEDRSDSLYVFASNQLEFARYVFAYYREDDCLLTYRPGGRTKAGETGEEETTPTEPAEPSEDNPTETPSEDDSENPAEEPAEDTNASTEARIGGGDYRVLACTMDDIRLEANRTYFQQSEWATINSLTLSEKRASKPGYTGWVNYNASYPYLQRLEAPVYVGVGTLHVSHRAEGVEVPLSMHSLTQQVRVRVHLHQAAGLPVDSVVGELSGVAASVNLSDGIVQTDLNTTGRVCFKMDKQDGGTATEVSFEGGFHAFGLIPGEATSGYGASILHVMIFTKDETHDMYVNLTRLVVEARPLVYDLALDGYRKNTDKVELECPLVLDVENLKNDIENGTSDMTPGAEGWFYGEADHEIEDET